MRWKCLLGCIVIFFSGFYSLLAQKIPNLDVDGSLYGQVIDAASKVPMEFATVALYDFRTQEVIKGTLTDAKGQFSFKPLSLGVYNLEISFVGYKKTVINQILILPKEPEIFLGEISLEASLGLLDEVVVTGQKEAILFKADRKVIDITSILAAQGGTLVDALENQPTVKTDMDGNMTLRGSPNFMVLVNGKPTALKGSDALQQIPANTVESVEIITNPSARFDSEGEVGIVNVITKKDFKEGISGTVNGNGGFTSNLLARYSGDAAFQLSRDKYSLSIGLNSRYTPIEGEANRIRETMLNDEVDIRDSDMDIGINRSNHTLKTGLIYTPSTVNTFTCDIDFGLLSFERTYLSRTLTNLDSSFNILSNTLASNERSFIASSLGFDHLLDLSNGHKFSANLFYSRGNGTKNDDLTEENASKRWEPQYLIVAQQSDEDGLENEFRLNMDYDKPINGNHRLESGYQLRYETTTLDQQLSFDTPGETILTANSISLSRTIHAWYGQMAGEKGSFSYQIGLRPEMTTRLINQTEASSNIDYFNLFPSANFLYSLSQDLQLKLGYSRRIKRPGINQLNPYLQLIDEKNQRSGNVELLPEYVNSFELGFLKRFLFSLLSADIFYWETNDKITPVWLAGDDDVLLLTYDNLHKDFSYGTEVLIGAPITDWWRINLSTSIYRYNINGDIASEEVNNSSNSWNARFGSAFTIRNTNTSIQVNALYNSEVASSQGARQGFFVTMLAVKQQLLENKLDISLQVRDIFNTIRFANESISDFFITRMEFSPYTPVVNFNISYRFNQYKKKRVLDPSNINELDFQNDFNF